METVMAALEQVDWDEVVKICMYTCKADCEGEVPDEYLAVCVGDDCGSAPEEQLLEICVSGFQ